MTHRSVLTRWSQYAGLALVLFTLAACVSAPSRPASFPEEAPPPDSSVYFYPAQGHGIPAEQQDRDKYECNAWAVQKTGFDPSLPNVPPHQRVRVVAGGPPPGTSTAVGAIAGATVGAAVSRPWRAGEGTLIGALAGAAIGGIADAERTAQVDRMQTQADAAAQHAQTAALEQKALDYRRAMAACLEGHGYSVR